MNKIAKRNAEKRNKTTRIPKTNHPTWQFKNDPSVGTASVGLE